MVLKKVYRKSTGRLEYALVSKINPKKVLYYFGITKPSRSNFLKQERRIAYFKNLKGRKTFGSFPKKRVWIRRTDSVKQRYWVSKQPKRNYGSYFVTPSKKHITQLEKITSERHGPIGSALDYPLTQSLNKIRGYQELQSDLFSKEYTDQIKASDKRALRLIVEDGNVKGAIISLRNPEKRQRHIHSIIIPTQYRKTGVASRAVKNLLKDKEIDVIWGEAQRGTGRIWKKLGAEESSPGSGIYKYDKTKRN